MNFDIISFVLGIISTFLLGYLMLVILDIIDKVKSSKEDDINSE